MLKPSCQFCAIIMGEGPARVVYRDDHAVAFFPLRPAALGHTLVVPRRHIPDIWELPEAAAACLSRAVLRVAAALRTAVAPDGLNIIQSSGAAATQTVPHLHVHLVPRWAADAMGPIWPAKPPSHPPQVLDNLRDKLAGLI
ncbi:MAG: HIT family protein [Corynebacterium sp.]|nr:MAG: HIT family protein [Corynebacterium sp.]